jgi:hypothetical protein
MVHLLFTVDYEIFGNGEGDVRQHILEPAACMAQACEQHGVPLTVFFEVEEYCAFERNRQAAKNFYGYDPALEIRAQIRELAKRGHDIQLHLHPQWVNGTLERDMSQVKNRADGGRSPVGSSTTWWRLDDRKQTVDSLFLSQQDTTKYIKDRKAIIEEMTGKAVTVYRAGAFSAQPSRKLLQALIDNGIRHDSSVVKGLIHRNEHLDLDYRRAPSAKDPWRIESDVAVEEINGRAWEIPIYSRMGRRFQQLTYDRLKAKFSRNVPKSQQRRLVGQLGIKKNPFNLFKFLFKPTPIKLDYHNLTPRKMVQMIKNAPAAKNGLPDVLVAIGHTKEHINKESFAETLKMVAAEPGLKISSFSDIATMLHC